MNRFTNPGFWKKTLPFAILLIAMLACSISPSTTRIPSASNTAQSRLTPIVKSEQTEIPLTAGYGVRGPYYEIYFTDPFNSTAKKEEGGPDKPLAAAIDSARISVDVAIYSLSLYTVQNALIHAHDRGVEVRIVTESDNIGNRGQQALKAAGIPVVGDRREGLMHNKFVIIDRAEVWTGSMNFTFNGTYQDNNNLVRILSNKVAEDYTVEFEEMFKEDFFGPDIVAATPYQEVTIDNSRLEIYFSPDDHVARRIAALLRGAQKSIYFMAYSFTADDFADILYQKEKGGLEVAGIMETDLVKSNTGSEFNTLAHNGLSVYLDGNTGLMHHKVFIIDESIVITGSYNFTANAERKNDENVVIFFDKQVAAVYMAEFRRVDEEAQKIRTKP